MKRVKILQLLCLSFFCLITPGSQAAVYIVIDQFSPERKFPIAVADLIDLSPKNPDSMGRDIAQNLRDNLKLAGYFDLINPNSYQDQSGALLPEEVNYEAWSAIGAKVFVKGAYQRSGKTLTLELRLYDPQLKTMLVGKEYKVPADQAYLAVHRFADEIMLALTGERGIFSTKIAAACGPAGQEQIVTMNVDGTERSSVTQNQAMNLSPTWAPGGDELVFTSYLQYFPELYSSRRKDAKKWARPQRLTFNQSLNITPEFSPDGQSIAFASSMEGDPDLYLIDRNGKTIGHLAKNIGIDISPSFSPDGKLLAFASERAGNLHIFVTDTQGSEPKRLTFTGYQNDTPAFSPRGDKIAFIRRAGGGFNIFSMNADGSGVEQLTKAGNNENPSFSPDGRYIAFTSTRSGGSNLYLMMWDGSNPVAITRDGLCRTPEWSPWPPTTEKP